MLQEPPKRKATATTAGNKEKVLKQDIDVLTSIRNNDTKTITTVMLKSYLTELGIKGISKLKKDDMIAKIKDHHGIF